MIADYILSLGEELNLLAQEWGGKLPVHTIFFGGGTPSLVSPNLYAALWAVIEKTCILTSDVEISLEANPGTLNPNALKDLKSLGFNRISLGVQSLQPAELTLLGRIHDVSQVYQAVDWVHGAGINNLNLDFMFGLPGQTLEDWQKTLQEGVLLGPKHLSVYALTLEAETPMGRWVAEGKMPQPDEDLAASMYEWAIDFLETSGFTQYEISNWASQDADWRCRHNLQYWRNLPYLGLGTAAHGCAFGQRLENTPDTKVYIEAFKKPFEGKFPKSPATILSQAVSRWDEIQETMMLGLRLVQEGVPGQVFSDRFGVPVETLFPGEINRLVKLGLLEWYGTGNQNGLRLTRRGRGLGNQVFMEFVGVEER